MTRTQTGIPGPHQSRDEGGLVTSIPATLSAGVSSSAVRLIARAEAMGLIELESGGSLNQSLLEKTVQAIEGIGVGRQLASELDVRGDLRGALDGLSELLERSPHPATEWRSLTSLLGAPLLSRLTGISESSIRRYTSGDRETPDEVATRLHFVAMVCADVLGGYNRYGLRRWFLRARTKLDGQSPEELLGQDWDVDGPQAQRVAELARSLVTMGAA